MISDISAYIHALFLLEQQSLYTSIVLDQLQILIFSIKYFSTQLIFSEIKCKQKLIESY